MPKMTFEIQTEIPESLLRLVDPRINGVSLSIMDQTGVRWHTVIMAALDLSHRVCDGKHIKITGVGKTQIVDFGKELPKCQK